jgi:hypothetical protein
MDEIAANIIDRENALADFDHAREDFEAALEQVPDEGMSYTHEGEELTISDLIAHLTGSLTGYSRLIDMMREAEYQDVRMAAEPENARGVLESSQPADQPPRPRTRSGDLEEMEAAHDELAAKLREMAYEEYSRQAEVYYPGSNDPRATRASDIIGLITDHYRRHARKVAELLEAKKSADGNT